MSIFGDTYVGPPAGEAERKLREKKAQHELRRIERAEEGHLIVWVIFITIIVMALITHVMH